MGESISIITLGDCTMRVGLASTVFLAIATVASCFTRSRNEESLISTHYSMNTAGFSYVGCYRDNPSARDLPVAKQDSVDMTPRLCNSLCNGYDYFAVQITKCYCGNSYGSVQEPTVTEGKTGIGKWHPGTATSTTPPVGITSLENAMAQPQYETETNTLGGIGIVDAHNKYVQEGCYHDCGGASDRIDAGLLCGGLNRNSVYRRPSTMPSSCQSTGANNGHPLLAQRGLCDPPQGALHVPTMPLCDKNAADCMLEALGHEDKSFGYTKPWENHVATPGPIPSAHGVPGPSHHQTFQTGHTRDNPPARVKNYLIPPVSITDSYMVHS